MKDICKGGNKSGLYGHMKMLIEKGKEADDSNVQLMNEEGETIADEEKVKDIIENFWGDLFCLKGNATYNNNHLYSHKQLHVHGTYKALCTKLQLH